MDSEKSLDFCSVLEKVEGSYKGSVDDLKPLIDEAFVETVKRVLATGKAGKLKVELSFNRVDEVRIEIKGDVKTTLPEPKSDSRRFYHDSRGNVFSEDPRQMKLPGITPLKKVEGGKS